MTAIEPTARVSHAERHEMRRKMAEAIKLGTPVDVVARAYRVSVETVRRACIENDVPFRRAVRPAAA